MFRCISSCSYIKPQLRWRALALLLVVYHLVPTSNHNCKYFEVIGLAVVYHLVPTSNHNRGIEPGEILMLYIILFLHQTTTIRSDARCSPSLYIILFLHQTTTKYDGKEYAVPLYIILFLHQTTTSLPFITR